MEKSDRTIRNREAGCVSAVHPVVLILNQKSYGFIYFPRFGLDFLEFYLFQTIIYFKDFRKRRYS